MGAACTGAKSVETIGSIKQKQNLSIQAREHLKNLQKEDHLDSSMNQEMLSNTLKKAKGWKESYTDSKIEDKDEQNFQKFGERKHEVLWQAVEANDTAAAEKFLSLNEVEEINMYDMTGQTMIHKAAALGYTEMLMLLLERTGAKPDLVNAQLATPLHLACRGDRENIVKFLIGCGVDANVSDEHGQTPLLIASIHGYSNLASLLIESSISGLLPETLEIDIADHRGLTALNCAAIKGELPLVQVLVSRGSANTNQTSPKGCTPLMYAGRGGFSEVVRYLLEKKASPLKQDSSGGTVLHHAIEKGHINVLEVMLEHGVDVYSAIEIADNAGRTPLFEAVESTFDAEDEELAMKKQTEIIQILTRKRAQNGFGAKINVINYGGQTPLYSAARQGNFDAVKLLVSLQAEIDLTGGELVKIEDQKQDFESYESVHEQCFMDAFMNTMTPLHVATVLGFDEIALYLIENGADVNLSSHVKGYTPLHLAVLSNKPEMLIELLTKTNANALIEDSSGRKLLDMIYKYIPSYLDSFQLLIEHLYETKLNNIGEVVDDANIVITHYVNPEDERKIAGMQQLQNVQPDNEKYREMFEKQVEQHFDGVNSNDNIKALGGLKNELHQEVQGLTFNEIDEDELEIEEGETMNFQVESVFGRKAALCLISVNWKQKELALKTIQKHMERSLAKQENNDDLTSLLQAVIAAVSISCQQKVIKVLNISLQLFNTTVQSQRIEEDSNLSETLRELIVEYQIVQKLLLKAEESNTRTTNKIHETLLDLSYHKKIGEDLVASEILIFIAQHYEQKISNPKGLLAQLALLFKFVASFGIFIPNETKKQSGTVLTVQSVLEAAVPAICATYVDVKKTAIQIVIDVQRLTGAVKESHLQSLPEKTREVLLEKIFSVEHEKGSNQKKKENLLESRLETEISESKKPASTTSLKIVNIGSDENEFVENLDESSFAMKKEVFEKNKLIVMEKGRHKDWMFKEIALNAMLECFENAKNLDIEANEEFVTECTILLKDSLETNNMQIYMVSLQVAEVFLAKTIHLESVKESLQSFIKAIVLHTTDTNTRVRKKSIDLINKLWNNEGSQKISISVSTSKGNDEQSISTVIAQVLTDSTLLEKAIVGRLGLFIKKALLIDSGEDLNKKAHQLIMGKDYEQLTEFACQWCMHKNTKVRQCALKLIVEICRLNHIDPRGAPFKQRIINFILALRPSLRDPLVAKINEVCQLEQQMITSNQEAPKKKQKMETFININQQELNIATNIRSASLDVRRGIKQAGQTLRQFPQIQSNLPQIQQVGTLPGISMALVSNNMPTLVLPHSEPLKEAQIKQAEPFLDIFGIEIMTCFFSNNWATRQAAMQKVEEQMHNFDPRRRDAMYGEINRNNQPPEVSFKIFLMFAEEGIKDPNLKNYLMILELVQKSLPIYFRYLGPAQIKRELLPVVSLIIKKCSDVKAKVREASINFCLYLSHQSPIGPQAMIQQVLDELQNIDEKKENKQTNAKSEIKAPEKIQISFGNNNLVASCLQLLGQFQQQTNIIEKVESQFFEDYIKHINKALRNQNPQVRKQGEALFKILYHDFGVTVSNGLENQKPQLVTKLVSESQQESATLKDEASMKLDVNFSTAVVQKEQTDEEKQKNKLQYVQNQLREESLNAIQLKQLLQGHEDLLNQLKLPNAKKRVKAIVEIKKAVQIKLSQLNVQSARNLLEPLTMLSGMLLKDDDTEVYLESLNFLKFVVSGLAPHLSSLDLHLMMGSFLNAIVNNNVDENMRIQMSSNKAIIFFAKHNNIGSFVVAKEVLKLIERANKSTKSSGENDEEEKKQKIEILVRLYSILQMILQQFSIVLCYQPNFYQQSLEQVADTMLQKIDSQILIGACTSVIVSLFQIDANLLEAGIAKLDLNRKTPLKKVVIEFQNSSKKGQSVQFNLHSSSADSRTHLNTSTNTNFQQTTRQQKFIAGQSDRDVSPDESMRDTLTSFQSLSKMSPSSSKKSRIRNQDAGNSTFYSQYQKTDWDERNLRNSEVRISAKSDVFQIQNEQSDAGKLSRRDPLGKTGITLADRIRKSTDRIQEIILPAINDSNNYKRQISTIVMEKTKKVGAGFRRDSEIENFSVKNHQKNINQGHLGIHQNIQLTSGLGNPLQVNQDDRDGPAYQPTRNLSNVNSKSSLKIFSINGEESSSKAGQSQQQEINRPPLYVPSRRNTNQTEKILPIQQQQILSSNTDFKSRLYQQTQSVQPAQPFVLSFPVNENSRGVSKDGQTSIRYQPSQMSNQQQTQFVSKMKFAAPPTATFQIKKL